MTCVEHFSLRRNEGGHRLDRCSERLQQEKERKADGQKGRSIDRETKCGIAAF